MTFPRAPAVLHPRAKSRCVVADGLRPETASMRDLLYFVIGILLGLICVFFDGSTLLGASYLFR
jgi:hypothetical protein